jgi:hypothetical protein
MAAYVTFTDGRVEIFYVREREYMSHERLSTVFSVQLDGDELAAVRSKCALRSDALSEQVVEWFDSDAKFIVRNVMSRW